MYSHKNSCLQMDDHLLYREKQTLQRERKREDQNQVQRVTNRTYHQKAPPNSLTFPFPKILNRQLRWRLINHFMGRPQLIITQNSGGQLATILKERRDSCSGPNPIRAKACNEFQRVCNFLFFIPRRRTGNLWQQMERESRIEVGKVVARVCLQAETPDPRRAQGTSSILAEAILDLQ